MNENWTIDLLIGDGDVENYNKFSLVYIAGSQERYKLEQSGGVGNAVTGSISGQAPIVIQHVSDNEAPEPARLTEANKQGSWRISVFDDENETPEWDTILNNIHAINRHFSGASSTAARHSVNGSAENVRIAITPEGATNTTYFDVRYGHADVSQCYYTAASQQTDGTITKRGAWFVPVNFVFTEAGYGDSFALRNDLPSSPHMIEDSDGDGLADGWQSFSTAPTFSLITTRYLVGGQCQRMSVTSAASTQGIRTNDITAVQGTDAVFYIYVYSNTPATDDIITIDLVDGSNGAVTGGVQSIEFDPSSPSGHDKTGIDPLEGRTWFRYVVSGNNSAAANFRFRIYRNVTDAVNGGAYFLDAAYGETGTLIAPNGWCSSSALKNRYDPASTSAATQQQINYLDVWGVPGDLPAWVNQSIDVDKNNALPSFVIMGREDNQEILKNDSVFVFEMENLITTPGWTTVTDATRSDGAYKRNSNTGITSQSSYTFTAGVAQSLFKAQWRVFGIIRSQLITSTLQLTIEDQQLREVTIPSTAANTWILADFGLFNGDGRLNPASYDSITANLFMDATSTAASTIDFDCLFFVPVSELLEIEPSELGGDFTLIIDAVRREAFQEDGFNRTYAGRMWNALPNVENRYIYLMRDLNSQLYDLDAEITPTLEITPRTSHLLGTQ